jgi:copper chaperone
MLSNRNGRSRGNAGAEFGRLCQKETVRILRRNEYDILMGDPLSLIIAADYRMDNASVIALRLTFQRLATPYSILSDVPNMQKIEMLKLNVPDMTCGHCVGTVTKAVQGVDRDATVTVDLPSKIVTIETAVDAARISQAVDAAGYPNKAA